MIRVLVVDDSSFMRKSITHILQSDRSIEVVATASDGEEAIRKVKQLAPDVVLLDIAMPSMDGLAALTHIMSERPAPVLVLSGVKDSAAAIKSLELGAVDFIRKPSGVISYDITKIAGEIIFKVKSAAGIDARKLAAYRHVEHCLVTAGPKGDCEIVVIGASTGGPRAVANVLSGIPATISAAIFVVQHMAPEFVPSFAERLRWVSPLEVSVASDDDELLPGRVFIAPGGIDAALLRSGRREVRVRLGRVASTRHPVAPSVDHAMESAAKCYGAGTLGVLLTGMGNDGAKGMKAIKNAGGHTIAEDESTCVVFGMPKAAIEAGCVDEILPLGDIAVAIAGRV
ncbi:MAG: chemotaxis-specific protein-glutamate methyltransferase CheB [Nitrospirae bacterium]|nr:chemotaxis-specific protein-glutamate methyltransferase CheB [Nitrospirota bacterium]